MSMGIVSPVSTSASPSVDSATAAMVGEMLAQWARHRRGNRVKQNYYDQRDLFKDLRISTPPELRNIEATLGWAAKTVDVLADRISFERFEAPGADENPFGLDDHVVDNDFQVELSQGVTSSLVQACAFVTVAQGLDGEGAQWVIRSAEQATGLWDRRSRGLGAGMTVSVDDNGNPERVFVYLRDRTIELVPSGGKFMAYSLPNPTGRIPMEVLRFRPDLRRPFGRSRISRAVRYYSDGGVRTVVRSEVGGEFFAAPQRYGIGIDNDDFDVDRWTALTGRFLTVSRDEEGELPKIEQFPQHSMQPHTEHLRMWASLLGGESSIPLDELGFPSDNPSSDSAIQSQRDPLRLVADRAISVYRGALRNLAITTVMVRDGLTEVPDELRRISARFAPTFQPSDAAAADAAQKQASIPGLEWLSSSPMFLRRLNYSDEEIAHLLEDKRRAQSGTVLDRILAGQADPVAADDNAK